MQRHGWPVGARSKNPAVKRVEAFLDASTGPIFLSLALLLLVISIIISTVNEIVAKILRANVASEISITS